MKYKGTKPKKEAMKYKNSKHILISGTDEEAEAFLESVNNIKEIRSVLKVLLTAVRSQ